MTQITDHLADIERRVALARARANRPSDDVMIVAVSKQQPIAAIEAAYRQGQRHFGESYLQEAVEKMKALEHLSIIWHFIGRIQANKTRQIAERFDWVHTIDRERTARRLDAQRSPHAAPLNVLIQLNLEEAPEKGGVSATSLSDLARLVSTLPRLRLRGVMAIAPRNDSEGASRHYFRSVKFELDRLIDEGFGLDTLSMGMSSDYEAAIECGSNCIRVGTALFGPRRP